MMSSTQALRNLLTGSPVGAKFDERAPGFGHVAVRRDAAGLASALLVGPTLYELLEPSEIVCTPVRGGFEFALAALPHLEKGCAASESAAEAVWGLTAHVTIQRLMRKSATALAPVEARRWSEIQACFDLEQLERNRSFVLRQIGEVVEVRAIGLMVSWIGFDDEPELVPFESAPDVAGGFERGERFEASVQRESDGLRLIEVLDAALLLPPTPKSERALVDVLARARTTADVCPQVD
jgi:hypothetical protein